MKEQARTGHAAVTNDAPQFDCINFLKVVAAQLIVLHHLAFYGPMSDHATTLFPAGMAWLNDYARMAVQVFLVIGGYLAAKSLSSLKDGASLNPFAQSFRRYLKLAPPFLVATVLTVGASSWARQWMAHDSISAPAEFSQLAAHAFLLHAILGYEAVAAGAWYVAIDFQLYAASALLFYVFSRADKNYQSWLGPLIIAGLVAASLLHFNRNQEWDNWAPYFFGSYGLGMMAWWAGDAQRNAGNRMAMLLGMTIITAAALALDFRGRIALAVCVAFLLAYSGRMQLPAQYRRSAAIIAYLGRISYSQFLIHFAVCLVINAAFTRFVEPQAHWQLAGMLIAWAASLIAGAAFHHLVEIPINRFRFPEPARAHVRRFSNRIDRGLRMVTRR